MSEKNETSTTVTQGEKMVIDLFLEDPTKLPRNVDLTLFTKYKVCLDKIAQGETLDLTETSNPNGSFVNKVAPDVLGHVQIVVFPVDAALIASGFGQDIRLERNNAGSTNLKRDVFFKALNVNEWKCP